jgi:hypothetical protein
MKITIFALLMFGSISWASEYSEAQLSDLKNNWVANELRSYSYTLRHGGAFGYTIEKITVRKGVCTARSQSVYGKKQPWKKGTCEGYRIHELISSVQKQELEGVFQSKIELNSEYKFISYYSAEPKTELTDQDWYFQVLNFKAK